MKFGICNHSIEHYTFIQPRAGLKTDLADPKFADFYWTDHSDANLQRFLELWVAKNEELIDKYKPDVIWFDNGANSRAYDPLKLKVAAYYYNRAAGWEKQVTLDTKSTCYLAGSVLDFEKMQRGPKGILPGVWEVEDIIGSTWGYTEGEKFRSPQQIVELLCDAVSKSGNLLWNLSPRADGTINDEQQKTLSEVGAWLAINGEAIYGTHSWVNDAEKSEKGPVYRFTVKDDVLYAITQSWPKDQAVIVSLANGNASQGTIQSVSLLGTEGTLQFTQNADGLKIQMPAKQPCKYAFVLKITGLKLNPEDPAIPAVPIN
jgi:alpha-L-fucosidase